MGVLVDNLAVGLCLHQQTSRHFYSWGNHPDTSVGLDGVYQTVSHEPIHCQGH